MWAPWRDERVKVKGAPLPLGAVAARHAFAWRPAAIAAAAGMGAFLLGNAAESFIVGAVRGDPAELGWISDAVLSVGVAAMAFLWLHLRVSRARVLELERDQIVLDEQFRLAAEIQRNLLPELPASTPGVRWAARMVPAQRIGGDFYDFVETAADQALVMLGDVSGKGVPAALVQSSVKALFRMTVRHTHDPAAIAEQMAAGLHELTGGMPYATAVLARFEQRPPRLTYVNAGHPPGLLLRDGRTVTLEPSGLPLGLLPGSTYEARELELRPGDIGLLVTDGITEALETSTRSLAERLSGDRTSSGQQAPAEICERLLREAALGTGPPGAEGWQDDRTVMVFRVEATTSTAGDERAAREAEGGPRRRSPTP